MSRWLVGSSSSSRSGSPASARASEARVSSPPEKRARAPVEVIVAEAEAVHGPERLRAPVPAAGVLEPRLGRARSASSMPLRRRALAPSGLEVAQALLERDQVGAAREHVVAAGSGPARAAGAGRGARPGRPSRTTSSPPSTERLAGEHAQQGGLAGPVAPGERHAIAALELEGDAPEQRSARHVLVQRRCDHDRHDGPIAHRHGRARAVTRRPGTLGVWASYSTHTANEGPQAPGCGRRRAGRRASTAWFARAAARSWACAAARRPAGAGAAAAPAPPRRLRRRPPGAHARRAHLVAAVYACGPGALLSHRAAGALPWASSARRRGSRSPRPAGASRSRASPSTAPQLTRPTTAPSSTAVPDHHRRPDARRPRRCPERAAAGQTRSTRPRSCASST